MGLLMNYPEAVPDGFRFTGGDLGKGRWEFIEFDTTWFPDAFVGPMASLMRALNGQIERPETDCTTICRLCNWRLPRTSSCLQSRW